MVYWNYTGKIINMFKNIKNNLKFKDKNALKDLFIISISLILIFIFSYFFDVFIFIVKFLDRYPRNIIYVDEVITGLLTLSIGFAIFSWRRWLELKKETTERIRLQEELLLIANTKAETERIVSKQLHVELDERKRLELFDRQKIKKQLKSR